MSKTLFRPPTLVVLWYDVFMKRKWAIWGAIITIVLGSLLHFVYGWSGSSHLVALFGAVNESTWEHLKLAFWPTFFIAIVGYFKYGRKVPNFWVGTFVNLFSAPLIIIILFYSWRAIYPDNFIWDISIFVVAVILSYYLSYRITKINRPLANKWIFVLLIFVGLLKFSLMTYYPVKLFITRDPNTGGYGILDSSSSAVPCTLEAKICPDGSAVGRIAPNCDFAPCP
jgi:hypothetical protein